ncbi:MAG: kinase [Alphaproteobacteria bacterium]|uniref:Kinase n=1 Tax=Candidatus Nitrobium versatile TaxID=2884831 RepID=A0A953JE41_9BACT|nr:kinase [Candidatus Nitrobium versatile]
MIVARTPFRISFFGGGTDYPVWYREHGGAVLSTSINKYCYISCRYLPPFFDYKYRIRYTLREETQTADEIKHPVVRECLKFLNIDRGIEMVHTSDIPARSGVGSSSAFTVCFLHALYALKGNIVTKRQLSREAIHIEQNVIQENVGSQDQVAAAFGGLNKIEFGGDKEFYVYPVTVTKEKIDLFQSHLMLFFTGFSRNASDIAAEQIRKTKDKKAELKAMMEMVDGAIEILNGTMSTIRDFGTLLHESWKLKRGLTELISTSKIDAMYEAALSAGAIGGKLLGAGGGGFMLLFAPPERHPQIREKLKDLLYVPFLFDNLGTQVVLYSTQDFF